MAQYAQSKERANPEPATNEAPGVIMQYRLNWYCLFGPISTILSRDSSGF